MLCAVSVDAHSWVEKVLSSYGEGASRVGMNKKQDVRIISIHMIEFGIL